MDQQELNKLIGLTLEEAKNKVPYGYLICPYCIEGKIFLKKENINLNVISVEINSNIITKAYVIRN